LLRRLHFDLWYLFRPPWDNGKSPPELLAYIDTHHPGRAIDLGCGTGTNVLTLAQRGWKVTGVDFLDRAIRLARRKIGRAGVNASFLVADLARSMDSHGSYDLALDIGCFHSIRDRTMYVTNLLAILKPGGHWLMYGFLKSIRSSGSIGLDVADLGAVVSRGFQLLERNNGVDVRGRPSAWFLFEKIGVVG